MNNLVIEKTKKTLGVNFDSTSGICSLEGTSLPENASEFFEPLLYWLAKYMMETENPILFNFRIDYLNSSSIKFFSDIFEKLQIYHDAGSGVKVNWYYDEDDEDQMMMGEEFREDLTFTFLLVSINRD